MSNIHSIREEMSGSHVLLHPLVLVVPWQPTIGWIMQLAQIQEAASEDLPLSLAHMEIVPAKA
jgi:hypothetical protein